jgi:hypothetical protein
MPRRQHGPLLNVDLLVSRRLESATSQYQLGRLTRLHPHIIRKIESGQGHQERTLGELASIGDALGLELHEMIIKPEAAPESSSPDAVRVLAALLAASPPPRRVLLSELAQALRWPHQRVLHALDELAEKLAGSGAAVARAPRGIRLLPRTGVLSRPELQRLSETRLPNRLWVGENARLLGMVSRGEAGPAFLKHNPGQKQLRSLGQLTKLGYIRKRPDRGYELTPETAYSYGILDSLPAGRAS